MILLYVKSKHAYYNISCLPKYRQFSSHTSSTRSSCCIVLEVWGSEDDDARSESAVAKECNITRAVLSFQRSEDKIKRKHSTRCFTKMKEQINGTILLLEGATQLAVAAPGLIA